MSEESQAKSAATYKAMCDAQSKRLAGRQAQRKVLTQRGGMHLTGAIERAIDIEKARRETRLGVRESRANVIRCLLIEALRARGHRGLE